MRVPESGVVIVVGTDTDVGKTIATAWLAQRAMASGSSVAVYKPAQTGVGPDDAGDADVVASLAPGVSVAEGIRLPEPLAPIRAAARVGITLVSIDDHVAAIKGLQERNDLVLVEGSGGVLVPLAPKATILDIGTRVGASAVIVARAGLGTLNHTALTCSAIESAGIPLDGVLIGSWPAHPGLAERCNAEDLADIAPLLGALRAGSYTTDALTRAFIPLKEIQ